MGKEKVHVLLVPWSAQGHITPMAQLAQILVTVGLPTTMVYTARSHARIHRASQATRPTSISNPTSDSEFHPQSEAHPDSDSNKVVRTEVIPDGLPEDEATRPTMEQLGNSQEIMTKGLGDLILTLRARGRPVTCLVSGPFFAWTADVAKKFGVPRVELWTSLAIIYSVGVHIPLLISEGFVPFKGNREETWIECIPGVPPMRVSDYPKEFLPETEPGKFYERAIKSFSYGKEAVRVLVNSMHDLESSTFKALQAIGINAVPVGPLFLFNHEERPSQKPSFYAEDDTCLQWLGGQEDASVMYVAFGSETRMSSSEIEELALGLEASEQPFLWVIRPGSLSESNLDLDLNQLPEGFVERTKGRSLIVSWAPQVLVLSHPSVGGFLCHCGWNSTMEAMWRGVPIVAWPQRADQGINKKLIVEDWKFGIAAGENGHVTRVSLAKAIQDLIRGEQGKEAKSKALEMKQLMESVTAEGGSSRNNLNSFIQDLANMVDMEPQ